MKAALAALALTLSSAGLAGERMTTDEMAAVQVALDRGQLLYAYDQAAWHSTDEMIAQAKRAQAYERIVSVGGGYIIEGDAGDQVVTFFDRSEPPRALFRAKATAGGTKIADAELITTAETLTAGQQHLVRERKAVLEAATAQKLGLCASASPNVTILPPAASSTGEVAYVMTPQAQENAWPMGGHYRFDLRDERAGPAKPFAKSCIALSQQASASGKPAALVISHLLDDTPTEIHVFTMLASRLPLFVVTVRNNKLWAIESVNGQARIRLIGPASSKKN